MRLEHPVIDGRDRGTTVIEMMVTLSVMAIAVTLIGSVLMSAQSVTNRMQRTASAIDDARLISATLDRELRSALCISSPAENATGNTLRFQSVAYGATVELTYVVASGTVTRTQGLGGDARVVIERVGPTTTAFRQVTTPLRTLVVDIPIRSENGGDFRLQTTVAGRNAWRLC